MILSGLVVAQKIYQNIKEDTKTLSIKAVKPTLAVILVGENPASLAYIRLKEKRALELGIDFKLFHLPSIATQKQLSEVLADLNQNRHIQGIVVQLPLPNNFDQEKVLKIIDPKKDIDGFYSNFTPPTAQAILEIFKFYDINLVNKKIVIVGRGRLVGGPLKKIFIKMGLRPIVCDSKTKNLTQETLLADILISAAGVPGLIKSEMIKKGAVLVDAGTSESDGKLIGDIDKSCYQKASSYSPVPGGVGPVTVACLFKNLIAATRELED